MQTPRFICEFIKNRSLHEIVIQSIWDGVAVRYIISFIIALLIPYIFYKIKAYLGKNQNYVEICLNIGGFETNVLIPVISLFSTVILVYINILGNVASDCNLITTSGIGAFAEKFIYYPSLLFCLFILVNVLISLLFATAEFFRDKQNEKSSFGWLNIGIAIVQFILFLFNLPTKN